MENIFQFFSSLVFFFFFSNCDSLKLWHNCFVEKYRSAQHAQLARTAHVGTV